MWFIGRKDVGKAQEKCINIKFPSKSRHTFQESQFQTTSLVTCATALTRNVTADRERKRLPAITFTETCRGRPLALKPRQNKVPYVTNKKYGFLKRFADGIS